MIYLLGVIVVHMYAPVENVNKPLDMEEKKKGRKESHILYVIWSVVGFVLYTYNYSAMVALTATVLMVIILMLAGVAKERKFKYAEKGK
jgi:accessory gene regulator protein AgrB